MKNKNRNQKGFTIAEILVALGILSIVLGIGMLGVVSYQKTLKLMEMDNTAKEIFVVAQNHMLAAKGSNEWEDLSEIHKEHLDVYLGNHIEEQPSDYPSNESWGQEGHDYRYIVYNSGSSVNALENTLLEIILPYGSIDEEVRSKGSYIIEYDYITATVYGVFYTDNDQTISYETDITGGSGLNNNKGRENSKEGKEARKKYKNSKGQIIIGYYGGAVANDFKVTSLEPIEMEVHNGDTLAITIKDKNYGKMVEGIKANTKLLLTVTGEESKASETYRLAIDGNGETRNNSQEAWWQFAVEQGVGVYTLVLDDITKQGGHFADLFPSLIPGENIIIEVEAFSEDVLCTPVKAQIYTNSLFESNYGYEENGKWHSKVSVSSIRHLQNLSPEVSNLPTQISIGETGQKVERVIKKVEQTNDLDWNVFVKNVANLENVESGENEEINIYLYNKIIANQEELTPNKFYGISNLALVSYEGHGHTLSHFSIQENESGNVGLFSQIGDEISSQDFTITNVVLDTFNSESTKGGNAGSLIGEVKAKGTFTGNNIFVTNTTVKAFNRGIAGGLVGKMSNGTLQHSGIYLTDDEASTVNKKTASEKYELGAYRADTNVQGSQYLITSFGGVAGGLIGQVEHAEITDTFAAMPVMANDNGIAGGLIGENKGIAGQKVTITNSYTGGYTKEGAYSEYYSVSALGYGGIAGGFIGRNAGDLTTIENSYSTASAYGSSVGGFIGKIEQGKHTYKNCYTTGTVTGISESSKRDGFIGEINNANSLLVEKCYTLKQSNKDLTASISGAQSIDYDGLIKETTISNNTQLKVEQYVYDVALYPESYPFGTVTQAGAKNAETTGVHYGDWPAKINGSNAGGDIGVLYYEIVEGNLYYHGYVATYSENGAESKYQEVKTPGDNLIKGLVTTPGKYVSEDGYMIVVPKGTDLSNIVVSVNNTKNNMRWERWKLSECPEVFIKSDLDIAGFDAYYFDTDVIPSWLVQSTYIIIGKEIEYNIKEQVSFYFNRYFADTVAEEEPTQKKFYIRSARHLVNMNEVQNVYMNNAEVKLIQTMDISFEDVDFTKNGVSTVYEYQTLYQIHSDYTVHQYKSGEELRGYVIKGLKVPLFGAIETSSTIKGVTLVNSHVKENASFAEVNVGEIESCSVRAENPGQDSYDSVTAAGFIKTNGGTGIIRNSYFVGKVTGDISSGFVNTNAGKIENCYANVILTGTTSASGFVHWNNGGTIKNSFVVGSVTSDKLSGTSYGFMGESNGGRIENCYSALFNLSGHQIFRFGLGRGEHYLNTVWLDNTYIQGEVQVTVGDGNDLREKGISISYEEMIQKATNPKTYPYRTNCDCTDKHDCIHAFALKNIDRANSTYPFELLSTEDAYFEMAFWGDWPRNDLSRKVGLLYYQETNNGLYYKGYLAKYWLDEIGGEAYKEIKPVGNSQDTPKKQGYIILVEEGTNKEDVMIRVRQNDGDNSSGNSKPLSKLKAELVKREVLHIPGFDAYTFEINTNSGKEYDIGWLVIDERVNHGFYPEESLISISE